MGDSFDEMSQYPYWANLYTPKGRLVVQSRGSAPFLEVEGIGGIAEAESVLADAGFTLGEGGWREYRSERSLAIPVGW